MDISNLDCVSPEDILSLALVQCGDEQLRNGFTRGFYISLIQRGLEELAFDTFFDVVTEDVDMDSTCFQVDMPCNMFNVREVYLFNGTCSPNSSVQVYWKRLFNNGSGGSNYTAARRDMGSNSDDPFFPTSFIPTNLYYANIYNGKIMFSSNCGGWAKVRLVGNGCGSAIGDQPVIPRFFRAVLADFVSECYFRVQMSKDRNYATDWKVYENRLYDPRKGSWKKAEDRVKMLSTWKRDTLRNTMSASYSGGRGGYFGR